MVGDLALCLLLTLSVRFVTAVVTRPLVVADLQYFETAADLVLRGANAYQLSWAEYSYAPLWMYVLAGIRAAANWLQIDFVVFYKLVIGLVDTLGAWLIYVAMKAQSRSRRSAVGWALAFSLNPLLIYVSGIAGQFDSIPAVLVMMSILILARFPERRVERYVAAAALGLAIALKTWPILFVPIVVLSLLKLEVPHRDVLYFAVLATALWPLSTLPFVLKGQWEAVTRPLYYLTLQSGAGGIGHLGFMAVLKSVGLPISGLVESPTDFSQFGILGGVFNLVMERNRFLFLTKIGLAIGYVGLLLRTCALKMLDACQAGVLLVYSLIGGLFPWYLSWIVPLAALGSDAWLIPYTVIGVLLLIFTHLDLISPSAALSHAAPYFNIAFWLLCVFWAGRRLGVVKRTHARPSLPEGGA